MVIFVCLVLMGLGLFLLSATRNAPGSGLRIIGWILTLIPGLEIIGTLVHMGILK